MSVFFNMLGIYFELYGHVLGLPRVSLVSEKIKNFRKIRPFFNGLIRKIQSVIKVRSGVRFWRGWAHFQAQSKNTPKGIIWLTKHHNGI